MLGRIKRLFSKPAPAVPAEVRMGKNVEVWNGVSFGSEPYLIEIGDNVRIAEHVRFFTHDGGAHVLRTLGLLENADFFGPIKIGNNVHIGTEAMILPGVTIGNNVVVGIRAVVTKDVPDNCIVAGVPARVIKTIDEYYEKHKDTCDFTKNFSPEEKKAYLLKKYGLDKRENE